MQVGWLMRSRKVVETTMRLPTDEELRILNEISEKEENGTLTPDEKERLVNRLKEIDEKESWPFV